MKKLIILAVSAALAFSIPEDAENVKRSFDQNGNEHISYSLNGKKIAVSSIKMSFKVEPVSGDRSSTSLH